MKASVCILLIAFALGCGDGRAKSGSSGGIHVEIVELEGSTFIAVTADSTEYDIVAFPNAGFAIVENRGKRFTLDGIEIDTSLVIKGAQLGYKDVLFIPADVTVLFPVKAKQSGDIVIDVRDSYSRELVEYGGRSTVLLWSGKIRLTR